MLDRIRRVSSIAWLALVACQAHAVDPTPEGQTQSSESGVEPEPTGMPTTGPALTTGAETTGAAQTSTGEGDATGSTGNTGSTGSSPTCGDGVVDAEAGEQCDLGYAENGGACTESCQLAYCGDGLVWAEEEQCDLGADNNDATYGGCREDCTPGPRCGDAVKQDEEECDASAPAVEGAVACDPDNCNFAARVAFVTAATFAGELGGLANADALCATAAAAAGLDSASKFLAYLGDGTAAPATRFTDGLAATGYPYARRDGQKLANDLADIFATGLRVPLDVTEYGTKLPPTQYAWTGVDIHGSPADAHCEAWSTSSFKFTGQVGQVSPASDSEVDLFAWASDGHWTDYGLSLCNYKLHLYCFED